MRKADLVSRGRLLAASVWAFLLVSGQATASAWPMNGPAIAPIEHPSERAPAVTPQKVKIKLCSELSEEERRKTERCKTEEEKREDEQKKKAKELAEKEKPTKTSFWRRVHLDLPAIRAENQQRYVCCSAVGFHLTVAEVKRLNLYGPPGVAVVRQRIGPDKWGWRVGYSWGFGYFLGTAKLPLTNRPARLYFNLTKVWTSQPATATASVSPGMTGVSMAGLSVVFAK
jgi:hypothetical protein